jgi:zinc transport system substrate-binding protein
MKRIKLLIIPLLILLTGCTLFKRDDMENINIITSIYPLEYSIDYLYGESSIINSIYPDDINTDEYELTDKQLKDNSTKDLFVYMGLTKDSDIAVELINRNKNLKLIDATFGMEYKQDVSELWLNPSNLLMILQNIKNGLDEYIDNAYLKKEIDTRYKDLKLELSELDASLKTTIENANKKTIYANSKSAMFLEKYGLTVIVIEEKHELYEKNLALLKEAVENKKVTYFYRFEDTTLPKGVKELVDGSKLKELEFRNLKNITDEERKNKNTYVDITEKNIENLKKELY